MPTADFSPHDAPAGSAARSGPEDAAPADDRAPGRTALLSRFEVEAADGARLSVLMAEPAGEVAAGLPPVLAIHGFASSAAAGWGRTGHLESLSRSGRTVFAVDLRGHGDSDKPHEVAAYSLRQVLDDLRRVAQAVAVRRPASDGLDVIGYSLGSRLAWTAAASGTFAVRRLVLGGFDGRPLFDGADPERLDRLAAGVPTNDRVALRALVAGLAGTGRDGLPAQPADVQVLIVAGDRDPLADRAEAFAATLPRASFLGIPGRSHISTVPSRIYRQAEVDFLARSATGVVGR